jgi:hypothetical protein
MAHTEAMVKRRHTIHIKALARKSFIRLNLGILYKEETLVPPWNIRFYSDNKVEWFFIVLKNLL